MESVNLRDASNKVNTPPKETIDRSRIALALITQQSFMDMAEEDGMVIPEKMRGFSEETIDAVIDSIATKRAELIAARRSRASGNASLLVPASILVDTNADIAFIGVTITNFIKRNKENITPHMIGFLEYIDYRIREIVNKNTNLFF